MATAASRSATAATKSSKSGQHRYAKNLNSASLVSPADSPGRFEVSPVLRQLFDADEVALVEAEYRRLLEIHADGNGDG